MFTPPAKPMRDHQSEFLSLCWKAAKAGNKRIPGCASVGWGKTRLSAEMFKRSYNKNKKAMFVVPRNALIGPTVEEFVGQGLSDIGIIQANHPRTDPNARLQVASIHTAINRELPHFDLVIVDEFHMMTKKFQALLDSPEWRHTMVIGLSATPWKKGMGFKWQEPLIQTKTTNELIDAGWLVAPRYLVGEEEPNISGLHFHIDEDGNKVLSEGAEAAAMGDKRIIGDVVKTYLEHGEGRSGFYYAVNLAEALKLSEAFTKAGVPCGYVDGTMTRRKRNSVLTKYRDGSYRLIVNYGVLTTGIDEDVRLIGIARIIMSQLDWVQIIGRGLRTDNFAKRVRGADPKIDCLVIDHGGNLTRDDHPMPCAEDIYHDHLDKTDPSSKSPAFAEDEQPPTHRKCKKCGFLIPPRTRACPKCGDIPVAEPKKIITVAGDFHEFDKKAVKADKATKQEFYSGLLGLAKDRGYSDGWASHKYREKFSVWPRLLDRVPSSPTKAVRDFEFELRKAGFSKGKEKSLATAG
jgi:superfamily II DNA or RNA helicase